MSLLPPFPLSTPPTGGLIKPITIPGGNNIGYPPGAIVVDANPRGGGGSRGAPSRSASEQQATVAGANSLIPLIYGRRRVGAKIAAVGMIGTDLVLLCIWCQGEVDAVESIQINDAAVPAAVTVTSYVGNQSQTADATLVTAFGGTYTDRLLGICYSVLRVPEGSVAGFPRATALIRGMKVPRVEFGYVTLNGTSAYGAVADSSSVDINEDFEVVVGLAATDWTPAADQVLASKWNTTGNQRSWRLLLKTTGALSLEVSTAGTAISATYTSASATTWTDTKCHFVRCRFVKTNGANSVASFATSEDGQAWSALGADQTAATIATVFNSTADLRLGADHQGNYLAGNVWALWIQTSTKTVADLVLLEEAPAGATFTDAAGRTWSFTNATVAAHTAWSKLPVNCLVDVLTNTSYGLGRRVDIGTALRTVYLNSEQIGTPAENRHELDLLLDTSTPADQWIATLADAAHCIAEDGDDKFYLVRDWDDAVVKAYDTTNIVEGTLTWSKRGARDQPTGVEVTWTNVTTTPWRDDVVTVYLPGVLGGSVPRRMARIDKPGITRYTEAYRRAVETLNDATTADLLVSFRTFDDAAAIRKGAIITVTHPVGFTAKKFRVTGISSPEPGRWQISGLEHDPARYSSEVVPGPTTPDTTLPSPNAPPTVTGLTATEDVYQVQTGYYASRLRIGWTEPATFPFVQLYAVEVRQGGTLIEAATVAKGSPSFVTNPLPEGLLYTVTVAIVSTTGARGTVATTSVTNGGKLAKPSNVPSFTGFEVGGEVRLSWVSATDLDLTAHEIRYGTTGGSWETATLLDRIATPALRYDTRVIAAGTWRFWIKGLDSVRSALYPFGQESVTATSVDITVTVDNNAFVAADYSFATPSLTRMTAHSSGTATIWATDMLETWNSLFPSTMSTYTNALYTYHASNTSGLVTETKDFGSSLTGDWTYTLDYSALSGTAVAVMELNNSGPEGAKTITGATNATPIVITSTTHGYATGAEVEIASVGGNTAANGRRLVTVLTADTFSLQDLLGVDVAGNGAYTSGGTAQKWLWVQYSAASVKTTARYGRLRVYTTTTGTLLVTSLGRLKCNVVARREAGLVTTVASGPTIITLASAYNKVKTIQTTPTGTVSRSGTYDMVETSSGRALSAAGGYTLRFDGSDDYVTAADTAPISMTAAMTVEFWMKARVLGLSGYAVPLAKWLYATQGTWAINIEQGRQQLALVIADSLTDAGNNVGYSEFGVFGDDVWNHVALIYDGSLSGNSSRLKLCVDGVQRIMSFTGTIPAALINSTATLEMGRWNGLSRYFKGAIDDVRIWNTARTPAQILANKDAELTGSESGLVAYYKFATGSGTTATDSTSNVNHGTLTNGPLWRPYDGFDAYAFTTSSGAQVAAEVSWAFEGV